MSAQDQKAAATATGASAPEGVPEHVSQNIDSIVAFHRREEFKLSDAQRRLEHLARWLGRPLYERPKRAFTRQAGP